MLRFMCVVLLCCTLLPPVRAHAAPPQLRAFWVDAFHEGMKTPAQTDQLIADVQRAGANALFVQVRRRADSYYRQTLEPLAAAADGTPDLAPGYDPLADVIAKAHARGIQVHAWTVTLPAWKQNYTQPDPAHVWYRHGPTQPGAQNWFMLDHAGNVGDCADNCSLDPGHPAAAEYIVQVLEHLVRHYDLDGLHLDYIRYPSADYGYNPVSLERFGQATGRTDRPAPTDPQWLQWRRDQVTDLVKRLYLGVHAIKPRMALSAATITWGDAPATDFSTTRAYNDLLQDWDTWLQQGYVDFALPMNYYDESDPTYAARFTAWADYIRTHTGRRAVAIGLGGWLNTTDNTFAQLERAVPGTFGTSVYSYALPTTDDRDTFLTRIGTEHWHDTAAVPPLPWLAAPTRGHVLGTVLFQNRPADGVTVQITRSNGKTVTTTTDGTGSFGQLDLQPGRYTLVVLDPDSGRPVRANIPVRAGEVTRITLHAPALPATLWFPIMRHRS